jgi:hypothetical protein
VNIIQPPPVSFEKYRRDELLAAARQIGYIALVATCVVVAVLSAGCAMKQALVADQIERVAITNLRIASWNARKTFDPAGLEELN